MEAVYDENRQRDLKAFHDSKAGVKGIVDSGILKIPEFFIYSQEQSSKTQNFQLENVNYSIPVIDLQGILQGGEQFRKLIVDQIRHACGNWGFFQVINHGIPESTMDEALAGVRKFHEQDSELKKEIYFRGFGKKVSFYSNLTLFTMPSVDWRDSIGCFMAPQQPEPEEFPQICRDAFYDYSSKLMALGSTLLELMSMALGLEPNHLNDIGCGEGVRFLGHYYPKCPQPELTFGAGKHTDPDFLSIVLQDQVGALQVLHQDKWIDIPPMKRALVVNTGDFMQLITNNKFKSVIHRVLARDIPRVSIACFLRPHSGSKNASRIYGPIKELLSSGEAPIYKEMKVEEYDSLHLSTGSSPINLFKL